MPRSLRAGACLEFSCCEPPPKPLHGSLESEDQGLGGPIQSILQEINPEYSLEGLMLKLKLQYFDHLM